MIKRQKPKFFFTKERHLQFIKMAKATKYPFTVRQSNYTLEILSEKIGGNGLPILQIEFLQNMMSESALISAKMVEKAIRESKIVPPEINVHELQYNSFADYERLKNVPDEIYCIDIKSAYLQALKNVGAIPNELFNKLQRLEKQDRLAAVGMLAANKNIWHYNDAAELTGISNEQNEMAPWFYYCIIIINEAMMHIKRLLGPTNFIFFWVDGIYFQHEAAREEIENYLRERGFNFTFEKLVKFRIEDQKRRHWISYWQEKETKCVQKKFCIPKSNLKVNKKIIDALCLHKDENSITRKIKIKK